VSESNAKAGSTRILESPGHVWRVTGGGLPPGIDELAARAAEEGMRLVERLIEDHRDGSNTFSKRGEGLWLTTERGRPIAVGGLNIDPYDDRHPALGRIRRVYVHPEFRRIGVGRELMLQIEAYGRQYFEWFQLFTASQAASKFYEALGYSRVQDRWKVSHVKRASAAAA